MTPLPGPLKISEMVPDVFLQVAATHVGISPIRP
jgi:hypothetical protein